MYLVTDIFTVTENPNLVEKTFYENKYYFTTTSLTDFSLDYPYLFSFLMLIIRCIEFISEVENLNTDRKKMFFTYSSI